MPTFLVISIICWAVVAVLLAAILTRWFRYLGDTDV
jgi:hypothetical protein